MHLVHVIPTNDCSVPLTSLFNKYSWKKRKAIHLSKYVYCVLLLILVHQGTLQELVSHMGPGVGMVHQVFKVQKKMLFSM